jgi:hypothetical protein
MVAEPAAKGRSITYCGSPYQTSMSEAGQDKALLVVDASQGWAVSETIPLDLGPRHHVLTSPAAAELQELAQGLRPGDRVLVLADEPDAPALAAFAKAQRARGAAVELREALDFESTADPFADAPTDGSAPQPDLMAPAALFSAYPGGRSEPVAGSARPA